jgi:hypothetical protein
MSERTAEIILRQHRFVQDVIDEITGGSVDPC